MSLTHSHDQLLATGRDVFEDNMVEAKDKARGLQGQGQGHKILSSRCTRGRGQSSRTPSLLISKHRRGMEFVI